MAETDVTTKPTEVLAPPTDKHLQKTPEQDEISWYSREANAVLDSLNVTAEQGLVDAEVQARALQYGPNELVDKGTKNPLLIIWEQLADPLIFLLIGAAVISGFLGKWDSTIAITAIVVLNAVLGFSQEYRAEQAINALKKMASPSVRVRRNGRVEDVPPETLVPGDIMLVEAGSIVPADGRVIDSGSLQVLEASLTGESLPVSKKTKPLHAENIPVGDRTNMLYMGTSISYGRGEAVVVNTGMKTQLGRIATLISSVDDDPTPLQQRLAEVGKALLYLALAIIAISFILGLLRPDPNIADLAVAAVAIAVAVVPEGLPAVVTIALALGAQRMLKRRALIRKLPAVETLGSVTVICSDKTGTLTENKMTVKVIDVAGVTRDVIELTEEGRHTLLSKADKGLEVKTPNETVLLVGSALASDAVLQETENGKGYRAIGDPTEGALIIAAAHFGLWKQELDERHPRIAEVPFESDRKRMSTVHQLDGTDEFGALVDTPRDDNYVVFTKGAVDSLLAVCDRVWVEGGTEPLTDELKERVMATNNNLAKDGLRVLGLAYRTLETLPEDEKAFEQNLIFVGMLGLIDPPRREVKDAVAVSKGAGIRPVMITGDHPLTALYIAKDLGMTRNDTVLTGVELSKMSSEELQNAVGDVDVYARVSPEHKLRIVEALKNTNQIVAMTGDGVNDAPALRRADIGVAMGITGTDVSKEASDMVLLDDNFTTIVEAAEEGRTIYDNVRKFIKYILGSNTGEVFVLLGTQALVLPLPLSTLQILYMNLVTDGLPALALAVEKGEEDAMKRPPYQPGASVFADGMWQHLLFVGALIFAAGFGVSVGFADLRVNDPAVWSTMVFTTLILTQMGHALSVRSKHEFIFNKGTLENKALIASVLGTIALQFIMIYVPLFNDWFDTAPLTVEQLGICVGISVLVAIAIELFKAYNLSRNPK